MEILYTLNPSQTKTPLGYHICLNLICKDEAQNFPKLLESCQYLISDVVILDTGSTDGSQKLVYDTCVKYGFGCRIVQSEWYFDYGYSRNLSLKHARAYYTEHQIPLDRVFALFIDPDEHFVDIDDKKMITQETQPKIFKKLDTHFEQFELMNNPMIHGVVEFDRCGWVKLSAAANWAGVVHEVVMSDEGKSLRTGNPKTILMLGHGVGCHSRGHKQTLKDAFVFRNYMRQNGEDARSLFYCAQSYGSYRPLLAYYYYMKRIQWNKPSFEEEKYISNIRMADMAAVVLYRIGIQNFKFNFEENVPEETHTHMRDILCRMLAVYHYFAALEINRNRHEAYASLTRLLRQMNFHGAATAFALEGMYHCNNPVSGLFNEPNKKSILKQESSISVWYANRKNTSLALMKDINEGEPTELDVSNLTLCVNLAKNMFNGKEILPIGRKSKKHFFLTNVFPNLKEVRELANQNIEKDNSSIFRTENFRHALSDMIEVNVRGFYEMGICGSVEINPKRLLRIMKLKHEFFTKTPYLGLFVLDARKEVMVCGSVTYQLQANHFYGLPLQDIDWTKSTFSKSIVTLFCL